VQQAVRLLIVEDVMAQAELVAERLAQSRLPCVHQVARTERAFCAALRTFRPHLIVSELAVAALDGMTALAIARREAPDTPFIFFSEAIGAERAIEAMRGGAADCVLKSNVARLAPAMVRALQASAERRRRRLAEQRIRASEQRLREIVDTAPDWIWEMDAEGRYVFSSESVRELLGLVPTDIVDTHYSRHLGASECASFTAVLASLGKERPRVSGTVAEWTHSDGSRRALEGNIIVLLNGDGSITGFRGTHRDVTERREQQHRVESLTRLLQMQSGVSAAAVRIRDRDELLRETCRIATEVGGYDHAVAVVVDDAGKCTRPIFNAGVVSGCRAPPVCTIADGSEPDSSLSGRALRTGEIAVCNDLMQEQTPVERRDSLLALGVRSLLAMPLSVDGTRIAALTLLSRRRNIVRDDELQLLQDMRANLSLALQYRQQENAVKFLASFDPLTGLANRALFSQRLDERLHAQAAPESSFAVVAFDVRQLSVVNDSVGRRAGDLLLQRVAERVKAQVEDDQRIGYLGGGTFVLVVPQLATSDENVAQFLESTVFSEVFSIEGRSIRVAFRSGIARFSDSEDGATVVQRAEAALTEARRSGETFLQYRLQMQSSISQRLALEHRLRVALDEQQFVLHYQPQLDVASGRIEAVEALLRWRDPEQGLVAPAVFLQVLESSGLIVPVGLWVLRQAVHDQACWQASGIAALRVGVNVSALQIRRRSFVPQVLEILGGLPEAGWGVDLEITETGLLHDLQATRRKLEQLREAGMRIALDDFGTGYSSLALLPQLPIDLLKIDRSFISGLPDDAASVTLVSSIVGLARAFDLTAVAEGVESAAQLEVLRTLRCHRSQGYLHSRPVPAAELERLLMRHPLNRPRE